jgi:ribosomal protein S12 methylthiotransferase
LCFFAIFNILMKTKKRQKPVTVGFIALGCPKNIVDSEKMLAQIAQAGFLITAEPENADVVVINTCGFIAPAKAEALDTIARIVRCKAAGSVKKVIVAGCLPQRLGRELFKQAGGIDALLGLGHRDDIAAIITKTLYAGHRAAYLSPPSCKISDDTARLLITPAHTAYLRISEGCDHKCSFCTIPAIKGLFRSKPPEAVFAEALELTRSGVVELNIIAQDTACYGRDLKIRNGLSKIARELEKIESLKWLRLMYMYPPGITSQLIDTIAASEKIVHYIDLPIQHINNKILKDMRRADTEQTISLIIEKLRASISDIVLRTTIIVGFPGETDEQFNQLLQFIKWAEFDALGAFEYYPEPGTPAAEMPGQLPGGLKRQRLEELMLTQQKIAFEKNEKRFGAKLSCLVDSVDKQHTGMGRFYGQAPDIDSICIIENCRAARGQFIDVNVFGMKNYDLLCRQISS